MLKLMLAYQSLIPANYVDYVDNIYWNSQQEASEFHQCLYPAHLYSSNLKDWFWLGLHFWFKLQALKLEHSACITHDDMHVQ